ncbi:MAG: hypothetical protein ACOC5T_00175 [Elusimicrobiota bacterium]
MYKLKWHKNLNEDRWKKFPQYKQLLMIVNELQRAEKRLEKNDMKSVRYSHERAIQLVDLTVSVNSGNFNKELLRMRDLIAREYTNKEKTYKE